MLCFRNKNTVKQLVNCWEERRWVKAPALILTTITYMIFSDRLNSHF